MVTTFLDLGDPEHCQESILPSEFPGFLLHRKNRLLFGGSFLVREVVLLDSFNQLCLAS